MPAPPPPIAPPPPSPSETSLCQDKKVCESKHFPPWEKITLTSAESEIDMLIARNDLKDAEITYFCQVAPILQDGPQCGLVALAMASQEYTKPVSVVQLLAEARVRGFTQHGEVYSVDFMATLAAEYLPDHRPDILIDLQTCPDTLTHALANGAMVLIPYDSDFNHSPCLKRGHKAHWTLLVGLISSRQGYYVLSRHGRSRHLACWPLRDLIESNGNLEEEGTARHAGGYVIPKGGVGGHRGLRGRALALHPYV
ncbi:actin maturation protease [Diachasmimorpha longicaudata]|uniref:actin maturation protease n=1 Tax=Diachasmimorpha longicaudata TaxID=58733 RepID=UPI0030B8D787